jgi:membrane peptidoglycan carboxypeptidase
VLPAVRWRRSSRMFWLAAAVVVALGVGIGIGTAVWLLTPSVDDLDARVETSLATHHAPALNQLPDPDRVGQALIATEDSRFESDWGVDPLGVLRGLAGAVSGDPSAGGASLDQQLAKMVYVPDGASLPAKVKQVVLGVKIDATYPKPEILTAYLNEAYFGHGFSGVESASRGYFGVAPARLSWAQASLLAGLVQAPSAYDPVVHLARARERQRHVLDRLVATGVLSRAEADAAFAAPLMLLGS